MGPVFSCNALDVCSIVLSVVYVDNSPMNKAGMLTKGQAIEKASARYFRTARATIVIERTAHPCYPGERVYLVAYAHEVHTLSDDSSIIWRSPLTYR